MDSLLEWNQSATFFFVGLGKVNQKLVEISDTDESCSLLVIVCPKSLEVLNGLLLDGNISLVSLAEEGINNDGNEEVEEHL